MKARKQQLRTFALIGSVALASALLVGPRAAVAAAPKNTQIPTWGFTLRTGPYQPQVGNAAEHDYYKFMYANGDDSIFKGRPLLTTLEFDFFLARDLGLLGWYFQLGYWRAKASTRICTAADGSTVDCTPETFESSTPGNDRTELMIFPLGIGAIYKMDLLKRRTAVPLVPYAKAGLDYYLWRNTAGGETSSREADPATGTTALRGAGATFGLSGTIGLALNLDWIEPSAAASAHTSFGMTDSYLFLEASYLWANGFGDSKRFDMSGALYQAGLAFDFQ